MPSTFLTFTFHGSFRLAGTLLSLFLLYLAGQRFYLIDSILPVCGIKKARDVSYVQHCPCVCFYFWSAERVYVRFTGAFCLSPRLVLGLTGICLWDHALLLSSFERLVFAASPTSTSCILFPWRFAVYFSYISLFFYPNRLVNNYYKFTHHFS